MNELRNKGSTPHKIGAQRRKLAEFIKCSAGIKPQQQRVGAFNVKNNPGALCSFMWLEGLKEACTLVHVEMLRGLSDFPSDIPSLPFLSPSSFPPSLSFMSLERCLSHSDSNTDCLRVIYAVIRAVL